MAVKKIKWVIKIGFALACVGALIFAFLPKPVKVDMVQVKKSDLLITLEGEGKTRIHDIYTVSAPIDGRISRIESEPGDIIIAGKTSIANMYPANPQFLDKRSETQAKADVEGAQAALALANARVKQAQAQLDFERLDFQRTQQLFQQQSVSQATLERAELNMKTLQAELDTAVSNKALMQSRLEAAQATLVQPDNKQHLSGDDNLECHICIHSPVDGRVLRVLHKSEGIVQRGTALLEVGDPKDLEVIIEMLSSNAVKVKVGDEAILKHWGGADIKARVRVVEPSGFTKISALGVEEQRVNVILSFVDEASKWQALGDAFRVEAAIIIDRAENVETVPLSALFRHNEIWSVFKVVDGVAQLTEVKVGRRNDHKAEILSGLKVGDFVITHPGNSVNDGVKVIER